MSDGDTTGPKSEDLFAAKLRRDKVVTEEARRLLSWHNDGGNIRQVDDIILRDMDANEDDPRRVHLIPIGEAIGFAITKGRAQPDDQDIVFISAHALGAAFAALGYSVVPSAGGAIVPPRFAVPDYKAPEETPR